MQIPAWHGSILIGCLLILAATAGAQDDTKRLEVKARVTVSNVKGAAVGDTMKIGAVIDGTAELAFPTVAKIKVRLVSLTASSLAGKVTVSRTSTVSVGDTVRCDVNFEQVFCAVFRNQQQIAQIDAKLERLLIKKDLEAD